MNPLKPYLLLLFNVFLAGATFAQKTSLYTFDLTDSIVGRSSFAAVKVIDNRGHKNDLGYISRVGSPFNEKSTLVTNRALSIELADLAERMLAKAQRGEDTLLLVLHDLYTTMDGEEYPFFYFRAVCFLGSNGRYTLVREVDSLYKERTSDIHRVLWKPNMVIGDCFKTMAEVKAVEIGSAHYSEQEAASYFRTQRDSFPAYTPRDFKKGIYCTHEDFLYQRALDTPFIKYDHFVNDVNSPFFFYKNRKGRKGSQVEHVFAVYDGKYWYLPRKQGAVKLKYTGGEYYTVVHPNYVTHRLDPMTGKLLPVLLYAP